MTAVDPLLPFTNDCFQAAYFAFDWNALSLSVILCVCG